MTKQTNLEHTMEATTWKTPDITDGTVTRGGTRAVPAPDNRQRVIGWEAVVNVGEHTIFLGVKPTSEEASALFEQANELLRHASVS